MPGGVSVRDVDVSIPWWSAPSAAPSPRLRWIVLATEEEATATDQIPSETTADTGYTNRHKNSSRPIQHF